MPDNQTKNSEPDQRDYTRAMLPGVLLGAFSYWIALFMVLIGFAIVRGESVWFLLNLFGPALMVTLIAVFFVGFLVRMLLCAINRLLGTPVGCSNLAVCVSGFTHYLLTAWVPLAYLIYEQDAFMLLLTIVCGPLLGMICGSVAVRLYERRQRTFVPYPRSQFQFQLQHLFMLTIVAAVLLVITKSLSNYQWLAYPIGYCLFQVAILMLLSWLPSVKYDRLLQNDIDEMLDVAGSSR